MADQIFPSSLPNGKVGKFYNQQLTSSVNDPPFTFSVIAGELPNGLYLNTITGQLSGSPIHKGPNSFTIRVVGFGGSDANRAYNVTINGNGSSWLRRIVGYKFFPINPK